VPFIFPFVFMIFLGWLYDVFGVVMLIVDIAGFGALPPWTPLVIKLVAFAARTAVLIRLGPVARMIMDPGYIPSNLATNSTVLLVRAPQPPERPMPQFQTFTGQGNVLASSPARE